jgi:hypothetical protein
LLPSATAWAALAVSLVTRLLNIIEDTSLDVTAFYWYIFLHI